MKQPHPRSGVITIGHGFLAIEVGEISLTAPRRAVRRGSPPMGGSSEPSHGRTSEGDFEVLHTGQRLIKLGYLIAILGCPITLLTRLNASLMRCTQRLGQVNGSQIDSRRNV